MKRVTVILVALIMVKCVTAQWTQENFNSRGKSLSSVCFSDPRTAYAVGDSGIVIKTGDAGSSWTLLSSGTSYNLHSVYFISTTTGFALGGTLLKTIDAGMNWAPLLGGKDFGVASVCFADAETGYAAGGEFKLFKTVDSGANWTDLSPPGNFSGDVSSVYFTDANTGIAVGDSGTILKTTNGGGALGVNDQKPILSPLKIFPDPASDRINIESSMIAGKSELSIVNLTGRELLNHQITGHSTQINIGSLPGGVYWVKVAGENGAQVGKLVKVLKIN